VSAPDFEISTRLSAETLIAHVPPDARTEVEGANVTLARQQTIRGLPEQMESGGHYRDIVIDKRLVGGKHDGQNVEAETRAVAERGLTTPTPVTAPLANGPSTVRGGFRRPFEGNRKRGSRLAEGADRGGGEGVEGGRDDMSDDTNAAARRRVARQKRRQATLAEDLQQQDGTSSLQENGASPEASPRHRSIGELLADYLRRATFPTALGVGAAVAAVAGAAAAAKLTSTEDMISGDVRIDLLNKIELLTIKLRVHRASDDRPLP
jgi:hypothetical protein